MNFALLILLILYILFSVHIYRLVCKKTENRKFRILTIVILFLFATWDNIIGLSAFYYLAWTQGGEKIYRTVENADGYLDVNGRYGYIGQYDDLVSGKYKFVEVEVKRNASDEARISRLYPSKGPVRLPDGKYRYYLDKAGSPNCQYFYERKAQYKNISDSKYFANFPQGYCMATEKVAVFKSKYARRLALDEDSKAYFFNVGKTESSVRDIHSGEVLGKVTRFFYYGGWIAVMMYGFPILEYPPRDPNPKSSDNVNLLYDVLKPIQN